MNWKEFWAKLRQIWEDSGGYLSSKRVFGSIGFICAIIMAFNRIDAKIIEVIIILSCAMLGLDSITDVWKNRENKEVKETPKVVENEIAG